MRAQRGRRPDAAEQAPTAPCRSRSMSSTESAPGGHPGDQARDFRCAFTPHSPPAGRAPRPGSPSPARCARAITGTSPACDTRFGSSNDACVLARHATIALTGVLSNRATKRQTLPRPVQRAPFTLTRRNFTHLTGGSRLRPALPAPDVKSVRASHAMPRRPGRAPAPQRRFGFLAGEEERRRPFPASSRENCVRASSCAHNAPRTSPWRRAGHPGPRVRGPRRPARLCCPRRPALPRAEARQQARAIRRMTGWLGQHRRSPPPKPSRLPPASPT